MRAFLLLCLLTISPIFSQIPTDDIKRYLFTNGSLVNEATPGADDLIPTGSSRINTMDPIGNINDAILVNSDVFDAGKRGTTTNVDMAGNMSVSFWIKTNTNDSSERNIMSQYGAAGFGPYGWNVILVNGKIRLKNKSLINGAVITPEISVESSLTIADNNWHHVVCVVNKTTFFSGGWTNGPQVVLYVDKLLQGSNYTGGASSQQLVYLNPSPNLTISIGGGTPNYTESIDNIRFYNKTVSAAEIEALFYEYTGIFPVLYVDVNATGSNNGGSWANAYTSLQQAINVSNDQDIWVKSGTYKPHASDRTVSFTIPSGVTIYGGFNGTETQLSERDWMVNPTILSGDLLGNDDATISFTNTLRNDNSLHIIKANSNNIILDGFTLSGAHANGSGVDASGAAITKLATVTNLKLKNCSFVNNVSWDAGACVLAEYNVGGSSLTVENCKFINNLSTYGTSFYCYTNAYIVLTVNVSNSLFDGNKAIDNGAIKGYSGSAGWFRAYFGSSTIYANFVNNTYVNNIDTGTNTYGLNKGTIGLSNNVPALMNAKIYNSVFWNNTGITGATSKAVNNIADSFPTTIVCNNSLDSDNFSTITNKQNIVTTNPVFESPTDYQLTVSSPAKDTGDNTHVSLTTDLNNNPRILNVTVDMGAYEFDDNFLCGFQVTSITKNTANVSWDANINTDLLYVVSGQSVASGTTITGLSTNAAALSGLIPNTYYDVYSSATCGATSNSGWYLVSTFRTKGVVYVNHAATGTSDGSSWANAYTSLQQAINVSNDQDIWIKSGTYKPHASDRTVSFTIPSAVTIYGGFNGTESQLTERNWRANPTILSGDLLGNDDTTVSFTNTLRSDNSLRLFTINANGVVIDGLVLSDAHANGSGTFSSGAAIFKAATIANLTIKNCEFKNNVSYNAGACVNAEFTASGFLLLENTKHINNLATYATTLYVITINANISVNVDVRNSLFDNNKAIDNGATKGYAGSGGWLRAYTNNTTINANFTNNTYVNNIDTGTNTYTLNRPTIGLSKHGSATAYLYGNFYNCIFWNNTGISNATSTAVNNISDGLPTALTAYNSLDSGNFSTVATKQNIVTTNPMFVSPTNYQLTATSPAINVGDNARVPVSITEDLLGAYRIFDTTVDMGVYEFGSALGNENFTSLSDFTMYPNPASSMLNINSREEISTIEIYSIEGKRVLVSQNTQVDVSQLTSGIYLVKITTNDNKVGTKKLVKQ